MVFIRLLRRRTLFALLAVLLAGCSNTSSSVSQYYYTDSWWHDDYWFYQDHVYPYCCHTDGEFKQAITSWWNTLEPEKQQEIKDNVANWKEGNEPDISALKNDFKAKFNSLPPEKQKEITQKREAIRQQMSDSGVQTLPANLSKDEVVTAGKELTSEQKQEIKNHWQSQERPTLHRSTHSNVPQMGTRSNISGLDFNPGGMRGRVGGRR